LLRGPQPVSCIEERPDLVVVTSRKLVHVRKVDVGGETLVVGSDFFVATPIWMKVEDRAWPRNPPG